MDTKNVIQKNKVDSMQAQVETYLKERMESGQWPVGYKIPSERELSVELGVSRITIRNAVLGLTGKGFFERSIGKGTFVRKPFHPLAGTTGKTGNIGYVICKEKSSRNPISSEVFYFDIFSGIEEVTASSGRHVLFSYLDDFDADEMQSFRNFLEKVDGVIIEEARNLSFLQMVRESGIPAVLLAPTSAIDGMDLITMDLGLGVGKAIRYLYSLGHRRIAIINGPLHLDSARIRFQAWKDTLANLGLDTDGNLVDGDEGWTMQTGYNAMSRLLDRKSGFTAVFCANDLIAMGALSALTERSLRIPDDMSVMGFDDTELARLSSPPLSSMKIYSRDMAHTAAQRLIERIENRMLPAIQIDYPIDLIERKSCRRKTCEA